MIFPLIDNIYEYEGKKWICWQQDLFRNVYLRSIVDKGGSEFKTFNWWHFMFNAEKIGEIKKTNNNY